MKKDFISDERKTYDLAAVSRTILPLAKNILGKKGFIEIDVVLNWDKIVGPELAEYSLPQRIDFKRGIKTGGTLFVNVPGGAFALEIQHRERIILEKINTYFGYNAVAALRIVQNSDFLLDDDEKNNQDKSQKNIVTQEEENYIQSLSCDVKNSKLKEILIKLGHSVICNNKDEKK